jgi:hypothetical protein
MLGLIASSVHRKWNKLRGGQAAVRSGGRKRGYQRCNKYGKRPPEHGHPDMDWQMGAALTPTQRWFLGQAPADHPIDQVKASCHGCRGRRVWA